MVLDKAKGRDVELALSRDGSPLIQAPVTFIGDARGLPTLTRTTDSLGRLTLRDVTEQSVLIEVPGFEQVRVNLDGPRAEVEMTPDSDANRLE